MSTHGSPRARAARISARGPGGIWVALAFAAATVAVVLLVEGRDQTFRGDEWDYAIRLSHQSLGHALLEPPPGKYLMAIPLLLYDGLFRTFGMADYLPYRVVGIALVLACSGFLFAAIRRQVGDGLALLAAVLIALFGSAAEVVVIPLRIPFLIAMAAGLGMVLALERFERGLALPLDTQRELRADALACALLSISLLSHPVGVAFAAAAVVYVLLRPAGDRWRRIWVFAVPIAIFAAWWLAFGAGRTDPTTVDVTDIVSFAGESLVACLAAATALAGLIDGSSFDSGLGWAVAAALVALCVFAIVRRRAPLPVGLWAALAALVVLWVSEAMAPIQVLRTPETGRYLYAGTTVLILALAQLLGSVRLGRAAVWMTAAVLAVGIAWNVVELDRRAEPLRILSARITARLGAVDIAGDRAVADAPALAPWFLASRLATSGAPTRITVPPPGQGGRGFWMRVVEYSRIKSMFGSPADSSATIAAAPLYVRAAADTELRLAIGARLREATARPSGGSAPVEEVSAGSVRSRSSNCLAFSPNEQGFLRAEVMVPPAGVWLEADDPAAVAFTLGMFGDFPGAPLSLASGRRSAELRLPTSGLPARWRLGLVGTGATRICALGSSAAE